jgi:hypothetical protein
MTAQSLTLYATRPAEEPVLEITDPVMTDLDQLMESVKWRAAPVTTTRSSHPAGPVLTGPSVKRRERVPACYPPGPASPGAARVSCRPWRSGGTGSNRS